MKHLTRLQGRIVTVSSLVIAMAGQAAAHPQLLPHTHSGQASVEGSVAGVAIFAASVAVLIAVLRRNGNAGTGNGEGSA